MRRIPYGDRGLLLTALSEAERSAWLARLEDTLPPGCTEYVVGYDSILLVGQELKLDEAAWEPSARAAQQAPTEQVVDVTYNGADLEFVAQACQLTVEQVIELHCAPTYTVRMMGFSPGFPYLDGLDSRLHLDRRASPRNHIAPGTVAIGGSHAGIYSVASPGGWHLLGHTDLTLFNLEGARHKQPTPSDVFALLPGDQVRFQPKATRR